MKRTSHSALIAMIAVLWLASAFYLYDLNSISFWEDESWMAIAIGDGLTDVWTFATNRGVHPPLYFYLAYALKPFISDMEFALRWMGGLVTLVGIALTFVLGRDVSKDWRVGVVASLIVVGSIYLLYLTRLARHYTLFYTLSVWIYWLYWRWQHTDDRRYLFGLMLAQAMVLYTHYFGAFIAVAITCHALLTNPRKSWQIVLAFIGSGILFIPWLPSIWAQLNGDLGDGVYYGANKLRDIPRNFFGRLTNSSDWLGAGVIVTSLIVLWREKHSKFALLLLLTIGTIIPIVIVNQTLFQWYIGRNMLYTLPLVAVFYGIGLIYIWRVWIGKIAVSLFLITFIVFGLLAYDDFYPGTADWRGIMRALSDFARPTDTFVLRGEPYSTDYYLRRYLDERVTLLPMDEWVANPTYSDRIWLIDSGQAVRFEAIDQIPADMVMTRRLVRLPVVAEFYQQVPDAPDAIFGEQLAMGYTNAPLTVTAGETLIVDMWWQALRTPDFNYSASVQLWRDETLIAQTDGNFDSGRVDAQVLPLELWTPDTRTLAIPSDTSAGTYDLRVTVYDWRDNTRLSVDSDAPDNLAPLTTVEVTAP
ncbi:MAG: glycosyltransferase family 39 protein [Chloroflexota bacterium]